MTARGQRVATPAWGLAVAAMLSVQLGSALNDTAALVRLLESGAARGD